MRKALLPILFALTWLSWGGQEGRLEAFQPYCGDEVCEPAECGWWQSSGDGCEENYGNCQVDCGQPVNLCSGATVYPSGGINWTENEPWPGHPDLGDCFGNCGAGCGTFVLWPWGVLVDCGPCQNWELELVSSPNWPIHGYQCWGTTKVNVT